LDLSKNGVIASVGNGTHSISIVNGMLQICNFEIVESVDIYDSISACIDTSFELNSWITIELSLNLANCEAYNYYVKVDDEIIYTAYEVITVTPTEEIPKNRATAAARIKNYQLEEIDGYSLLDPGLAEIVVYTRDLLSTWYFRIDITVNSLPTTALDEHQIFGLCNTEGSCLFKIMLNSASYELIFTGRIVKLRIRTYPRESKKLKKMQISLNFQN